MTRLFGPRHSGLKLATLTVAVMPGFVSIVEGDYRVMADVVVEAESILRGACKIAVYSEHGVRAPS